MTSLTYKSRLPGPSLTSNTSITLGDRARTRFPTLAGTGLDQIVFAQGPSLASCLARSARADEASVKDVPEVRTLGKRVVECRRGDDRSRLRA